MSPLSWESVCPSNSWIRKEHNVRSISCKQEMNTRHSKCALPVDFCNWTHSVKMCIHMTVREVNQSVV